MYFIRKKEVIFLNKNYKKNLIHILIAVLCASLISILSIVNAFYRFDNILCDKLYQREQLLDGRIVVLGIDARALMELGKFETWDRSIFADVIQILNSDPDCRPSVIGIDIMFFSETNKQSDTRLAEAANQYNNLVVGSSINFKKDIVENGDGSFSVNSMAIDSYEEPFKLLKNTTRQGFVNTMLDADGIIRTSMLYTTLPNGQIVNSFSYELYKTYAEINGFSNTAMPPLNKNNQWYIPFSAKPGGYSDSYSILDVLTGELPPEMFADCIVLIGPYATGMMDSYTAAIDHSVPMHGVEIHANILQSLLDERFRTYVPSLWQGAITFVIIFLMYFAFMYLTPKLSTPLLALLLGGYTGIAYILSERGYLLKLIYLPLALILMYFAWLAIGYIKVFLEKKRITNTFKKYVAPQIVDELVKSSDTIALGGIRRDIACMFVDIRGFTPMSEVLTPEQVVSVLNEYLDLTCKSIFKHEGTLDKFIGDATMAIFNAPLDLNDYAYKCVLTAWDIVKGGDELGQRLFEKYGRTVSFGIGLNLGPAVVGNIGNDVRMDYTAIGDTVNTAARLESQAKPGQVLLSESIYEAVKDRVSAVDLGEISLKGKAKGVRVYGLSHINEFTNQASLKTASVAPGKDAISYGI